MNDARILLIIAICALCTLLERAFPFLIFRGREVPPIIRSLGSVLPMAIIATLIIYCMKNIGFSSLSQWAPQILAAGATVCLHLWKRSTLLSIFGVTAVCMILTQFVFL